MQRTGVLLIALALLCGMISQSCAQKKDACRMICKMVTPGSCKCANGQLPSWHKRKRREAEGQCREEELIEKHNKYVQDVTEMIDSLLIQIYGKEDEDTTLTQSPP